MKAFAVRTHEGGPELDQVEVPVPEAGEGEVLIRVMAAGVTPSELLWYPTTHRKDGSARVGAIPGHEFSGVVTATGTGVSDFAAGDEVFGMNDWFAEGATAEFCVAAVTGLVRKPEGLSHLEAASVPISALTAWQGLVERAKVAAGERVLIHGAAGAVGLMAVQIARIPGCQIIATAAADQFDLLRSLGVSEIIDYRASRFEEVARDIDVVVDTVGADMLQRSEPLLRKGGRMVTIAADAEGASDPLIQKAFFIVEPSAAQLEMIAQRIGEGRIRTFVKQVFPFSDAPTAYRNPGPGMRTPGKVVIDLRAE